MITRIVKLHFKTDKITDFLVFFETIKQKVNQFEGCYGMQLMQSIQDPAISFTYSQWEDEVALNKYRDSETFGHVWPTIKPWFEHKAEAWTVTPHFNGFEEK
jgi:quinol monooxygenase YgiN